MKLILIFIAALVAGALEGAAAPAGASAPVSSIKGAFTIPVSDPQGQLKTLFTGTNMKPLPDGRMQISSFVMSNREPALVVHAGECILNPRTFEAISPGTIRMVTTDGRFTLDGEGFSWNHQTSRLVVSNKVVTRVRVSRSGGVPAAAGGPGEETQITSGRFEYDAVAGDLAYHSGVLVTNSAWTMQAASLKGRLGDKAQGVQNATADGGIEWRRGTREGPLVVLARTAQYAGADQGDTVTFEGQPRWEAGAIRGSGDQLIVQARGDEVSSETRGNAVLELPGDMLTRRSGSSAPGGSNAGGTLRITSARHSFKGGRLIFEQEVVARMTGRELNCARLECALTGEGAERRLETVDAEGGVDLRYFVGIGQVRVQGSRLNLKSERSGGERVVVSGPATWSLPPYSGAGEEVRMVRDGEETVVETEGGAVLRIPRGMFGDLELLGNRAGGSAAAAAAVPAAGSGEGVLEVRSTRSRLSSSGARFLSGVVVEPLPGKLTCQELTVAFAPGTNRVSGLSAIGTVDWSDSGARVRAARLDGTSQKTALDHFQASGGVLIDVERRGETVTARGANAVLSVPTQRVELTGEPMVRTAKGVEMRGARVISWDVKVNKFRVEGPFNVDGPPEILPATGNAMDKLRFRPEGMIRERK